MAIDYEGKYTLGEEVANSIIHGFGALLSVAGLSVLVTLAAIYGDGWRVVSFAIYGATMIIMYLASTFYHGFTNRKVKAFFRVFDHSAIFLLIAGTYTPFTLVTLRGAWGWTLFGLIWGFATAGIIVTVFLMHRLKWVAILIYVIMGWLVVIAVKPMLSGLPFAGLMWLLSGGLFYTGGIVFYIWDDLPYNHAIWHVFVLLGTMSHFFCILFYVLPMK
ncbi:MAG: PAQR family membrane homeostasis protein TrhA [Myxococcota bacterium]